MLYRSGELVRSPVIVRVGPGVDTDPSKVSPVTVTDTDSVGPSEFGIVKERVVPSKEIASSYCSSPSVLIVPSRPDWSPSSVIVPDRSPCGVSRV
mgnify:CR=1 FL=1